MISCSDEKVESSSVTFDAHLDTTVGYIGDVFHYNIAIRGLDDQTVSLPVLVIPEGEVKSVNVVEENEHIIGADFEIVYWDTGQQIIPSFTLDVMNPDSSIVMSFKSDPMFISILSMVNDPTGQGGLKPVKPPVPVQKPIPWKTIVPISGMLLSLLLLILLWQKRSVNHIEKFEKIDYIEPDQLALSKIAQLKKSELSDIKQTYTELSYILREYVEKSLYIRTLEMTTEEIRSQKNIFPIPDSLYSQWIEVLLRSDMTKYAKHIPDLVTMQNDIDWAPEFVEALLPFWKRNSVDNQSSDHSITNR